MVGTELRFAFTLPQGAEGATGAQGLPGPPFASAVVDAVTTVNPGDPAAVAVSFDGATVHFSFAIPQGNAGGQGVQGETGIQGPPGEVTLADLNNAMQATLNQSSNVSNAVPTFDSPLAHPDMEALRQKLNELILALRR